MRKECDVEDDAIVSGPYDGAVEVNRGGVLEQDRSSYHDANVSKYCYKAALIESKQCNSR